MATITRAAAEEMTVRELLNLARQDDTVVITRKGDPLVILIALPDTTVVVDEPDDPKIEIQVQQGQDARGG